MQMLNDQTSFDFEKMKEYARAQAKVCKVNDYISPNLYHEYGVNTGLRDVMGKGVLTGLTGISKIEAHAFENGRLVPGEGRLWYRGYPIQYLIESLGENEMGYDKIAYLLVMGQMPDEKALEKFKKVIIDSREMPTNFTRDVIMKAASKDLMNSMTRSILTLASYDDSIMEDNLEISLRQCIQLIAQFPQLAVYAYHAYNHYINDESMYIYRPDPKLSAAENILQMLRPDQTYTPLEAKVLDTMLILHMEHGGGNNSTFTTRVVTSSGSDTYSTIAAAMSSLKGSKHGGANIKVMEMMQDITEHVEDKSDAEAVRAYLEKILNREAFDCKGLLYGMGHAVYSLSDPREVILKEYAHALAKEKGCEDEFAFYNIVEKEGLDLIAGERKIYKGVCANVDFYSGFVYKMLGIPIELYTAMFAVARIAGWSAHRIEELICMDKIIRPAYMSVMPEKA